MANVDRLYVYSGSLSCGSGNFGSWTWTFNFATTKWQKMTPVNGPQPAANAGMIAAYDPNTGLVFLHDGQTGLYTYNYTTNTYTKVANHYLGYYGMSGAIDPKRKLFVLVGYAGGIGGGRVFTFDISGGSSPTTAVTRNTTGATTPVSQNYGGLDYDPVSDRIIAWSGGNTVYSLNLDTNVWTSVSYSGGPSAASTGTYGRWRYSSQSGVFVTLNNVDLNAKTFRLTAGGGSSTPDTIPPSLPTGLTTTPSSSSQINLAWNASTDNVGVAGYRIYRGGSQIATSTTTSYADTGLSPSTTYSYAVAAYDAAGNVSVKLPQ
jgi:hypothetical protein